MHATLPHFLPCSEKLVHKKTGAMHERKAGPGARALVILQVLTAAHEKNHVSLVHSSAVPPKA